MMEPMTLVGIWMMDVRNDPAITVYSFNASGADLTAQIKN